MLSTNLGERRRRTEETAKKGAEVTKEKKGKCGTVLPIHGIHKRMARFQKLMKDFSPYTDTHH
jgi:hypothetical protein